MPFGHHIARCLFCGKEWMVGDCIPSACEECERARPGRRNNPIDALLDEITERQKARNQERDRNRPEG